MEPLTFVLGLFGVVGLHLLASELYLHASWAARKLIERAARTLDPPARSRYEEEWLAHLEQCQGNITKLLHGFGCYICARKLSQLAPLKRIPTPTDTMTFNMNGTEVQVDVATAAQFFKLLRKFLSSDGGSNGNFLTSTINRLEREFVLGPPDIQTMRILGELMLDIAKDRGTSEKPENVSKTL